MDIIIGDEPILDQECHYFHPQPSINDIEDHRFQRANFNVLQTLPIEINQSNRTQRQRRRKDKGEKKEHPPEPSQHVMFLLGEDDDDETHNLFCEMNELRLGGEDPEWKETARWIKFEEDVEEGGERWSKPHVASLSLLSLFEARNCIRSGVILLNIDATNFDVLIEIILNNIMNENLITSDQRSKVKELLLRKHSHLRCRKHKQASKSGQLSTIRSLADIGNKYSSKDISKELPNDESCTAKSCASINTEKEKDDSEFVDSAITISPLTQKFDAHFLKKIPFGSETSNILIGETEFLSKMVVVFVRLKDALMLDNITEVPVPTRFLFILLSPPGFATKYHEIGRSMATLMTDDVFTEVAYKARNSTDLLAGFDEFLTNCTVLPPAEWDPSIRIEPPKAGPVIRKVPSLANGLLVSMQSDVGYKDKDVNNNDGSTRNNNNNINNNTHNELIKEECHNDQALERTGRLFGGLINDVKRRAPYYLSDFTDGIHVQCFGSFFFLYFACLTPIITFGGLLLEATGGYLGAIESLMSGTIVGVVYSLFAGQPLTIMGSTGPVLVFEGIIYNMCERLHWDYLSFRLWIGVWIAIFLFLMVAFDLSALVRYITRFTEESFAALIALIFIVEAFKKQIQISFDYPVDNQWDINIVKNKSCQCVPNNETEMENYFKLHGIPSKIYRPPLLNGTFNLSTAHNIMVNIDWNKLSNYYTSWNYKKYKKICTMWAGVWEGPGCQNYYIPDIFFFSCLLFLGTFAISYGLKLMRNGPCCPNKVRSLISDFAVMIAISLMTTVDLLIGFNTQKLLVPDKFEPTIGYEVRGWIVAPLGRNPWWTIIVAIGPAILAVILIFMDQQITAVIVNRRENKMKKGYGYHLDLLIVSILILVNSILGIPWFVAATVLSINHVMSLKKESENVAPGEQSVFLGCREQRLTGTLIFLMIGLSVFLTPILKRIPMPVLYGVFLFMGVSSLKGVQLLQRICLFFMPQKYQPDYIFLRHVRLRRVHLFTIIQILLLALLWIIKTIKSLSIGFPIMVLALCFVRKGLEYIFTYNELKWLDDIMPGHKKDRQFCKNNSDGKEKSKEDGTELILMAEKNSKDINGNDLNINISNEMGETAIWKHLTSNFRSNQTEKEKKRHRREKLSLLKDDKSHLTVDSNRPLLGDKGLNQMSTILEV